MTAFMRPWLIAHGPVPGEADPFSMPMWELLGSQVRLTGHETTAYSLAGRNHIH
jgi:hypothetical protein